MIRKLFLQTFLWFGLMGVILFIAAGTLRWPGAWIFLMLMIGLGIATGLLLAHYDPALLEERLKPPVQRSQAKADRFVMIAILVAFNGWLILMGLDRRFGWSSVPDWVQAMGAIGITLSILSGYRVMRENSFLAPVVKIQAERAQRIITTGPYRYVRHPFYTGSLLLFLGAPLLLGSWWGLTGAAVLIGLLCIRILIEENTLRSALPDYEAYAARVRYRLIPLVW